MIQTLVIAGLGAGVLLILLFLLIKISGNERQQIPELSHEDATRRILKKVKQIEIATRSVVNEVFSGE